MGLTEVTHGGQDLGVTRLHIMIEDVFQRGFEGKDLAGLGYSLGSGGGIPGQLHMEGVRVNPQQLGGC